MLEEGKEPGRLGGLGKRKLGLYIFGNGACSNDGASSRLHLLEIASHGYLAIAPGRILNGPGAHAPASQPERQPNQREPGTRCHRVARAYRAPARTPRGVRLGAGRTWRCRGRSLVDRDGHWLARYDRRHGECFIDEGVDRQIGRDAEHGFGDGCG